MKDIIKLLKNEYFIFLVWNYLNLSAYAHKKVCSSTQNLIKHKSQIITNIWWWECWDKYVHQKIVRKLPAGFQRFFPDSYFSNWRSAPFCAAKGSKFIIFEQICKFIKHAGKVARTVSAAYTQKTNNDIIAGNGRIKNKIVYCFVILL